MNKAKVTSIFSPTPFLLGTTMLLTALLAGCTTQKYENDTPVVQNQANRDEMAATRISLGLGYLKMGNMAQAKLNLEKAKVFSPELVQVYTAFAHYYEVVDETELTVKSYEKALSIKADDADTLNNYGVFLCRQKKVGAAEVQFLRAIAVPSYLLVAQSYENLASCYLQIDDFSKAKQYLHKAIDHSPNRTTTLLQMVRLQYAMAEYGDAKKYLQKFERNTRRFTADSLALAYKVYRKFGQRRTAKNYGTMLVQMYPQSWESKQYLLNELELIEADNLAKRYQLTQRKFKKSEPFTSGKSKKRIVKLSPKSKAKSAAIASLSAIEETSAAIKNTNAIVGSVSATTIEQSLVTIDVIKTAAVDSKEKIPNTSESQVDLNKVVEPKVELVEPIIESDMLATSDNVNTAIIGSLTINDVEDSNKIKNKDSGEQVLESLAKVDSAVNSEINAALTSAVLVTEYVEEIEAVEEKKTEIDNLTGTLTHVSTEYQEQTFIETSSNSIQDEPTSTMPIAATRDIPLPEGITLDETSITHTDGDLDTTQIIEKTDGEKSKGDLDESLEISLDLEQDEMIEINSVLSVETSVTAAEPVAEVEHETSLTSADEITNSEREKKDTLTELTNKVVENNQTVYHQVNDGDTLFSVSVKYNVKLQTLRKWNNLSTKHKLQINEKVYVVNPETVTNIND